MELSTLTSVAVLGPQLQLRFHVATGTTSNLIHRLITISITAPSVSAELFAQLENTLGQQAEYEQLDESSLNLYLNYAAEAVLIQGKGIQEQVTEPSIDDLILAYRRLAQLHHNIETDYYSLRQGYDRIRKRVAQQLARSQEKRSRLSAMHEQQILRTEGQVQAYQHVLNFIEQAD